MLQIARRKEKKTRTKLYNCILINWPKDPDLSHVHSSMHMVNFLQTCSSIFMNSESQQSRANSGKLQRARPRIKSKSRLQQQNKSNKISAKINSWKKLLNTRKKASTRILATHWRPLHSMECCREHEGTSVLIIVPAWPAKAREKFLGPQKHGKYL